MRKNLEKIFTCASIVVAVILIMILIVTAFGGIKFEEFESNLVRGLLITMALLYFVLSVTSLILMFINRDVIRDITIRTEAGGAVKVSSKVIGKYVKNACKSIDGVKCKKVTVLQDDYGVRLKISIKVVDKDVIQAEAYLRSILEAMFMDEFGFKFETIEIKVMALTTKYVPNSKEIEARVKERINGVKDEANEVENANVDSVEESANEENATYETPVRENVNAENTAAEENEVHEAAEEETPTDEVQTSNVEE